jgi:DNA repair protein RadC
LAISQAGAYILRCSSLKKYLKVYQEHYDELLQTKEIQKEDEYGLAVYTTWKLSYERLGSSAKTLLQILSFLHHEGITEEIFKRASISSESMDELDLQIQVIKLLSEIGKQNSKWNSVVFQEIMGDIKSYSLVGFDDQNEFYSIHPLVQHWGAWTLGQQQNNIQICVLSIIGLSISSDVNNDDYKYQYSLLEHINSSISAFKLKDINALIATNIAKVYDQHGQWKKAEVLQVVVMEKRMYVLGDEHPDTLTSMGNLASTYWNQGRWKEAEALEVVVMEKCMYTLGEEHPATLRSMGNLASTYWNQGQWKEAEVLMVVVMEKRKHVLGDEHPDTLRSMGNLASTYRKQGQWKEAEALEVVVMEKTKHALGDEHPDTLTSMASLAATYRNQGQWKEAEALEVVVMEKRKHVLGDEHPDTLTSMASLAATYRNQGQWKKAEELQEVVMEKRKQLSEDGSDDSSSLSSILIELLCV